MDFGLHTEAPRRNSLSLLFIFYFQTSKALVGTSLATNFGTWTVTLSSYLFLLIHTIQTILLGFQLCCLRAVAIGNLLLFLMASTTLQFSSRFASQAKHTAWLIWVLAEHFQLNHQTRFQGLVPLLSCWCLTTSFLKSGLFPFLVIMQSDALLFSY